MFEVVTLETISDQVLDELQAGNLTSQSPTVGHGFMSNGYTDGCNTCYCTMPGFVQTSGGPIHAAAREVPKPTP